MNCERMEGAIIAYMDGRATAAERAEVEAHIAACATCAARVQEFAALWKTLEDAPAHELSPAFDARLRERIAAEGGSALPAWLAWLRPQPRLALAAALLLVAGVWIGTLRTTQTPENNDSAQARVEEEFRAIKDVPVLEDYELLANFEALGEVPRARRTAPRKM